MSTDKKIIYRIAFIQDEDLVELYAEQVSESDLFGFITIEKLLFGETSTLVVDPSVERLKEQFKGVTRTFVPMHSILRIDEVEKEGVSKMKPIQGGQGKVSHISSLYNAKKGEPREKE